MDYLLISMVLLLLLGCGSEPQSEGADLIEILKSYVDANKESTQLNWIVEYPFNVESYKVPEDPEFSDHCIVVVYGHVKEIGEGKIVKQRGTFLLGKIRADGHWKIISGNSPMNVEYESFLSF